MCSCYGMSPCAYLFPDVACAHFRLLIDTLVYTAGRPAQMKDAWNRAAVSAGIQLK